MTCWACCTVEQNGRWTRVLAKARTWNAPKSAAAWRALIRTMFSTRARERQKDEMGTLGSGNHYLEVQRVAEIFDPAVARTFGLKADAIVISIHCGSRGLGHQIGTEFLKDMALAAAQYHIALPDRSWPARR